MARQRDPDDRRRTPAEADRPPLRGGIGQDPIPRKFGEDVGEPPEVRFVEPEAPDIPKEAPKEAPREPGGVGAPEPKAPEPKAPEPKAPEPKAPEPKAPAPRQDQLLAPAGPRGVSPTPPPPESPRQPEPPPDPQPQPPAAPESPPEPDRHRVTLAGYCSAEVTSLGGGRYRVRVLTAPGAEEQRPVEVDVSDDRGPDPGPVKAFKRACGVIAHDTALGCDPLFS
jgi:hypothetical protein